jgi:hypothetical protein
MSAPHAEINTAGVIIAVRTASACESGSMIGSKLCDAGDDAGVVAVRCPLAAIL